MTVKPKGRLSCYSYVKGNTNLTNWPNKQVKKICRKATIFVLFELFVFRKKTRKR